MKNFEMFDNLVIEPLSDEALELVAGGQSSDGKSCCSCQCCSNAPESGGVEPGAVVGPCDEQ